MSRKQAGRARPGKAETERKRDKRAARRALAARERRNRPQAEGEGGLAGQLQALGLRLREVPGDGNCLFRALGDQLEGHSRDHLKHRQETVDYMIKQREDFEPFVEDDVPFEKHVANLAQPGTFAGNDAIVAFARNNQVNVVIHQLNAPLWQIRGTDRSNARELHIAYRYGEHYDSVRKINDNSEAPARLQTEMLCKNESNKKEKIHLGKEEEQESAEEAQDEIADAVQKVRNATGCLDSDLIAQILETEDYNIESAIFAVFQLNEVKRLHAGEAQEAQANRQKLFPRPALWEENGSSARILGSQDLGNNKLQASPAERKQAHKKQQAPKVSNKQRKEQQRLDRKRRQEDRQRQKVLAGKSNNSDNNKHETDSELQVTLVKTVAALNI